MSVTPTLLAIGTALPDHCIPQGHIAAFMASALGLEAGRSASLQRVYAQSGIDQRYTVVEDYLRPVGQYTFYPNTPNLQPAPGTAARMALFRQHAPALGAVAAQEAAAQLRGFQWADITHLVVVSCTGMYAPGLDLDLMHTLGLRPDLLRTGIHFMGCYAAFNALRMAHDAVKATPDAVVLVVSVELCTLHFQNLPDSDNLASNAIFGDGAAACVVAAADRYATTDGKAALALEGFRSGVEASGSSEMAWHVGDTGFEIRLSSYVPKLVEEGIAALLAPLGGTPNTLYAVHPGGLRILQAVERALGLPPAVLHHSYESLKAHGNLSSATILFVLKRMLADTTLALAGRPLLACAFGPGLTMEALAGRIAR